VVSETSLISGELSADRHAMISQRFTPTPDWCPVCLEGAQEHQSWTVDSTRHVRAFEPRASFDWARFTFELEGYLEEVRRLVRQLYGTA
jgi:hypothetical protein